MPEGKVYVDALLDVHKTYHALVINAFRGDAEFVKCLDNVWPWTLSKHSIPERYVLLGCVGLFVVLGVCGGLILLGVQGVC